VFTTGKPPLILVVDDDEGLLLLTAEAFRTEGCQVVTASSGAAALACLEDATPDLMLLDLKLKDVDGQALLERLQLRNATVPFVVVTGEGDERVAVEMMKRGALDYVMKDTRLLDQLPAVVHRALNTLEQKRALAVAEAGRKRLESEIVGAAEREQQRIGADLHDNLGQQLTAIQLMCTALKEDAAGHPSLAGPLQQVCQMLNEAVMHTRLLARGLVPVGGGPDALQTGLAELAARTDRLGRVWCRFECPEPVALDAPAPTAHLYRIAQEAVNNALKHANAHAVLIRLTQKNGALLLEISDDGAGLPPLTAGADGMGLGVMRHRAALIGAELEIGSKPGKGVTVRCRLPAGP
jgi:signal transduction histidine kinase